MTPMPPILYLVVQDFDALGIGSPDVTASRDTAYDLFADAVEAGRAVAVWQIATHGEIPCGITDATDAFEVELQEVCLERGYDTPDVRRFTSCWRMAAE